MGKGILNYPGVYTNSFRFLTESNMKFGKSFWENKVY